MTKPENPPGTPLRDADVREGRVFTTRWSLQARYAWDAGVAIGRYLSELKEGKIIGTECGACRRVVVPPRVFCEWCFRPMSRWVELKDTGRVNTFSICYVTWDAARVERPFLPAVIEIDGASKGVGILHLLGEVDPKEVRIGMQVKAVWRPPGERTGSITDILHFRPL